MLSQATSKHFTLAIQDLDSMITTSFDVVVASSPLAAIRKAACYLGITNYRVVRCASCSMTQIRSGVIDL